MSHESGPPNDVPVGEAPEESTRAHVDTVESLRAALAISEASVSRFRRERDAAREEREIFRDAVRRHPGRMRARVRRVRERYKAILDKAIAVRKAENLVSSGNPVTEAVNQALADVRTQFIAMPFETDDGHE